MSNRAVTLAHLWPLSLDASVGDGFDAHGGTDVGTDMAMGGTAVCDSSDNDCDGQMANTRRVTIRMCPTQIMRMT